MLFGTANISNNREYNRLNSVLNELNIDNAVHRQGVIYKCKIGEHGATTNNKFN